MTLAANVFLLQQSKTTKIGTLSNKSLSLQKVIICCGVISSQVCSIILIYIYIYILNRKVLIKFMLQVKWARDLFTRMVSDIFISFCYHAREQRSFRNWKRNNCEGPYLSDHIPKFKLGIAAWHARCCPILPIIFQN